MGYLELKGAFPTATIVMGNKDFTEQVILKTHKCFLFETAWFLEGVCGGGRLLCACGET
jgi:hypothetical protein